MEKEIRFIDSHYNELFRIPDSGEITLHFADGHKENKVCKYIDSYHTDVNGVCFHICQFAEIMEQKGQTYTPADITFKIEPIKEDEFQYMFAPADSSDNRGCICYIRGYFDNSVDENFQSMSFIETKENYVGFKTQEFSRECDNLINYLRHSKDNPLLTRKNMYTQLMQLNATPYGDNANCYGLKVQTQENTYYLRCTPRKGDYNLYCYCYNTQMLNKYKDLQFVKENYGKIDRDKFFKIDGGLKEMYYNPDSIAGGQIVEFTVSFDDIKRMAKLYKNPDHFFSHLEGVSRCTAYDVGSNDFINAAKRFIKSKADFEGCSEKTMQDIKKYAGIKKAKPPKETER